MIWVSGFSSAVLIVLAVEIHRFYMQWWPVGVALAVAAGVFGTMGIAGQTVGVGLTKQAGTKGKERTGGA